MILYDLFKSEKLDSNGQPINAEKFGTYSSIDALYCTLTKGGNRVNFLSLIGQSANRPSNIIICLSMPNMLFQFHFPGWYNPDLCIDIKDKYEYYFVKSYEAEL